MSQFPNHLGGRRKNAANPTGGVSLDFGGVNHNQGSGWAPPSPAPAANPSPYSNPTPTPAPHHPPAPAPSSFGALRPQAPSHTPLAPGVGFSQPATNTAPGVGFSQPAMNTVSSTNQRNNMGNDIFNTLAPENAVLRGAAQMGLNQAQAAMQSGVTKYMPGMALFWSGLKFHFNVSNKYVLNKMLLLVFPFRQKSWNRERSQTSGVSNTPTYTPPVADINAPDLYIPLMSFVTYVLLVGLLKGTRMKFTPETLNECFFASAMTLAVEVMIIKGMLYSVVTGTNDLSIVETFIYCSYKFLGLTINMICGLFFGTTVYNVVLAYTATCMAFFMFRNMQHRVPAPANQGAKRRLYFLAVCAGLQVIAMWWLGYTRDLAPEMNGGGVMPIVDTAAKAAAGDA